MKKLNCQIFNKTRRKIDLKRIKEKLMAVHTKFFPEYFGDVNIIFVGDRRIRQLNKDYLKKTDTTDVISFYYASPPDITGDIFISVPQASRQARSVQSLSEELLLLSVHGFLHLAGFTDYNYKQYHKMWQMQTKIMEYLSTPHKCR